LTFEVEVDPPEALRSWRWRERADGNNLLCEIELEPGANQHVQVGWKSLVLVRDQAKQSLPAAAAPDNPAEAEPWLRATACVQSDAAAIVAKARELAEGCDDVESYVRKVLGFTTTNQGTGAEFVTLDALAALSCGGSCTNRANLCAALLRAHGIAARTQAHLPTWSKKVYEHWLVEYWHPGKGWTWIESTLGDYPAIPRTLVVLNVANPEDEDLAFGERIRHSGVMTGAPFRAVHDIAKPLRVGEHPGLNSAKAQMQLRGSDEQFATLAELAEQRFIELRKAALAGNPMPADAIHEAVAAGDLDALIARMRDR